MRDFFRKCRRTPSSERPASTPTLVDDGYLTNPRTVICPASALARQSNFHLPTLEDLSNATGDHLLALQRVVGGSYGYVLGYRENGVYKPTRNLHRCTFAVVADVPSEEFDREGSPNHGWAGHNVLFEDGRVVYLRSCYLCGSSDNIFRNDRGQIAPGCHPNDSVIVRSEVSPWP